MTFGVIRPGWDVEGTVGAYGEDNHCFYSTYFGRRYPDGQDWEGMQRTREQGDRIGMLLDLEGQRDRLEKTTSPGGDASGGAADGPALLGGRAAQ